MTGVEKIATEALLVVGYCAYFYRLIRKHPGDKFIEFGGAAVILMFLVLILSRLGVLHGWILAAMGVALVSLCFAAFWVPFNGMLRGLLPKRRSRG